MALSVTNTIIKINGVTIPTEHRPPVCTGVLPPVWTGETNLSYRPSNFDPNGRTCSLLWAGISDVTIQWWDDNIFIGGQPSVDLNEAQLPDHRRLGVPIQGVAKHGLFYGGIIHALRPVSRPTVVWGENKLGVHTYFIGEHEILITHIGELPPQ